MIKFACSRSVKPEEFNEVWCIAHPSRPAPVGAVKVPELAPSNELFEWFTKQGKNGEWGKTLFDAVFAHQYLNEFGPEGLSKLLELRDLDKAGKHIAVVCTCPIETICHRSIVAGFLQAMGCAVETDRVDGYYAKYAKECPVVAAAMQQGEKHG